jgi:hypothetical protein
MKTGSGHAAYPAPSSGRANMNMREDPCYVANLAKFTASETSSNADNGFYKNVGSFFEGPNVAAAAPKINHMAPSF